MAALTGDGRPHQKEIVVGAERLQPQAPIRARRILKQRVGKAIGGRVEAATTIDRLSGGRLVLGIASGDRPVEMHRRASSDRLATSRPGVASSVSS